MPLTSSPEFAITISAVTKEFRSAEQTVTALNQISARIRQGTITGIIGPDGAGKTTLMRMLATLLTPSSGSILVTGLDIVSARPQIRQILGYMPQKFGLYEDLSVIENLNLYAELHSIPLEEKPAAIAKLLTFTGLTAFINRQAGKLSGGMKQKLGLACTLLSRPRILLLDEPSVGVDPISRQELWKIMHALIADGLTVIWSTAYLDEAEMCDEVILLEAGKTLYQGVPAALTERLIGRTIRVEGISGNRRKVLKLALNDPNVSDGVIQGQNLRLVLREKGQLPDLDKLNAGADLKIVPAKPSFEEAYIDILGGGPGGKSDISDVMKPLALTKNMTTAVAAHNLTKTFGDFTAAQDISFVVKPGQIFCLLGPNGAGKSTTFKMLCGLVKPTSGTARIFDIDLHENVGESRQKIGYMAQKFSLYNDLSVKQNLVFFAGIYGLSGRRSKTKIIEMVDTFALKPYLKMTTRDIPLGIKQRLALACSMMHEPLILFLDEPTSGVDALTRREFWNHINGVVEKGVTVIVTTHFIEEAEYCDQIALIYAANIIASGAPDDIKNLAATASQPAPTIEDAFIYLIKEHDKKLTAEAVTQDINPELLQPNFLQRRLQAPYFRRWAALAKKETLQILRDPGSIIIAFILPILMLLIFGFGINLDSSKLRLGLVLNDQGPEARQLAVAFKDSPYINAITLGHDAAAKLALTAGHVRGFSTILPNFSEQLLRGPDSPALPIITDGSETNTANFAAGYAFGADQTWQFMRDLEKGQPYFVPINLQTRYWYNPDAISRHFLVPGSIAIIMTVIGALLTSLVVAREWERGTMEALLATRMTRAEFFFSKLIPYYCLGIIAMGASWATAVTVLGTPFRGSFLILLLESTLFLGSALGAGLFLSTIMRNQFNAAQAALNIAFLPAVMMSGFVYEISSMPPFVRVFTYLVPARYFVSVLQTLFLAGNVWELILKNALFLLVSALVLLGITYYKTRDNLD